MKLEEAISESYYGTATIVTQTGLRYTVEMDGDITVGEEGFPVHVIDTLPYDVKQLNGWEPVQEAES